MIAEINISWGWAGFEATEVIETNAFGNIIFKTRSGAFWRICPEELSCEKIAGTEAEFDKIRAEPEFSINWEMAHFVKIANSHLGELAIGEKYCLKMPAVLGGKYDRSNFGKINFTALVAFSGDLAFQIEDLPDGQPVKFVFVKT